MFLYIIRNSANSKVYIGKSIRPISHRWNRHLKAASEGSDCLLYLAMRKYGARQFAISLLSVHDSKDALKMAEIAAIKEYGSLSPGGYNMTTGGEGGGMRGKRHSEETRAKMRSAATGRDVSLETRRKLSASLIGNKCASGSVRSAKYKRKMSLLKMGATAWNKGLQMPELRGNQHAKGYRHTKEAKRRIGLAAKGNRYAVQAN